MMEGMCAVKLFKRCLQHFQEVIHETMKEGCLYTTTTTRVDNVLKDEVHAVTTTTTTQGSLVVLII
jgi:hypothetical protein